MARKTADYKCLGDKISEEIGDKKVRVWGSDDDNAIISGISDSNAFENADHLLCELDSYDNCKRKLTELSVPDKESKDIFASIFGQDRTVSDKTAHKIGLIDMDTEEKFDEKLRQLVPV